MMTKNLWDQALQARARVEDQEAEAEKARSVFHELIRQLNTSGASLREIASRVQLSHQRVHQIVEGVACSFCDRRRAECRQLVAGPGVFICDVCTTLGLHALAQGWGASDERTSLEVRSGDERCCFCRKRAGKVGPLASRGSMRICGHCLTLATREFERASEPKIGRSQARRSGPSSLRNMMPRAEEALAEAAAAARSFGHQAVADHHLLIGLMAVEKGVASIALTRLGVSPDSLQKSVLEKTPAQTTIFEGPMAIHPDTKRLIETAVRVAIKAGSPRAGTEHLLIVLARDSDQIRGLLDELGVDPDRVRPTIEEILGS